MPTASSCAWVPSATCSRKSSTTSTLTAKVGLVKVRLYRPFSIKHFVDVLPETVQKIAVMDRTKEPGSIGEPLYQDVVSALYEAGKTGIKVVGGRYGLGSRTRLPRPRSRSSRSSRRTRPSASSPLASSMT